MAPAPESRLSEGESGSKGAGSRLVLASASPQRREILARLGLDFEVVVPEVDEVSGGEPEADVRENARRKAAAVSERLDGPAVVIGCDTDVVDSGRILGKPADEDEARDYLRRLSGRSHEVISALAVTGLPGEPMRIGVERSKVRFRELDEGRIEWYVGTGEWRGRAGGYAIQGFGSALVAAVEGDLSNVIGLPVPVLVSLAPEVFA